MKNVKLGNLLPYQGREPHGMGKNAFLDLDIDKLIESRMGVFASSGGGKTYALFKILEATSGLLPQVVLDNEGDFAPLRKRHDFLLAGPGGDFPTQVHLAPVLCKKLLEENCSCIIDLYELKPHEKHRFVRLFLETWLDAPRNLWRPRLLLVDEAHNYAPEKGQGDSEALAAMTETSAKGRKRKIGLIAATQRVAKISKNFTAELGNKLVGVAYQDQDRARAGKELEFTNQEQIQSLRRLTAGQFYAFGPALGHEVKLAQIGMPEIKPTGTGRNLMKAPAPTSKVKAILDKFKDLPKEAQEEAKTIDALKKNNADLAAQVRALERRPVPLAPAAQLSEVDLKRLRAEYHKKYDDLTKEFDRRRIAEIKKAMVEMQEGFILASNQVYKKYSGKTETPEIKISTHPPASQIAPKTVAAIEEMVKVIADGDKSKFQKMDYVIVNFLGIFPKQTYTVAQAAYGAGYSQGGGFSNALSRLSSAGVIKRDKGRVALLDYGFTYNPSAKSPIEAWLANLQKMDREIWKYLMLRQGESFSVQELAERTNYSPGGGFSNALSRLSSCEMIIREKGFVKLNQNILELL